MAEQPTTQPLIGYRALIGEAIDSADPNLLRLVEEFMREEHGTLDALSRAAFIRSARTAYSDVLVWHASGALHGVTLADYCEGFGFDCPTLPAVVSQ